MAADRRPSVTVATTAFKLLSRSCVSPSSPRDPVLRLHLQPSDGGGELHFDMHQDSHGLKSAKRSLSFVPHRYLDGGPLGRSLVNQRGQFIEGPWILFISELLVQHWGSKLDCLPSKGGVIRFAKKGRPFQCTIFPRSHGSHLGIGTAQVLIMDNAR